MSQATPDNKPKDSRQLLIVGALTLVIMTILAFWGGLPSATKVPLFLIGLVVLLGVSTGISILGWYLLVRPVSFEIVRNSPLSAIQRQVMGVVLIVGTSLEAIGGGWDEAWHSKYGIPQGTDFFWRPHLLIYAALLTVIVLAGLSWIAMVTRGTGNWTQRFRADPLIGLVVLMGLILVYAVPVDPLWHAIYGEDISPFSIPHVVLTLMLVMAFMVGTALLISGKPARAWRSIMALNLDDLLPIVAFDFSLLIVLLLLTAEWISLLPADLVGTGNNVLQRPEWVFPAFMLFLAAWFGLLVNHTLRRYGAATLVAILMLATRLFLVIALNNTIRNVDGWLLIVPPMLAIDLLYAFQARRGRIPSWWLAGIAAAAGGLVSLLLLNRSVLYPQVRANNVLVMVLIPSLAALMGSWIGQTLGDYLTPHRPPLQPGVEKAPAIAWWVTPAIVIAALLLVILFVVTASPPATMVSALH